MAMGRDQVPGRKSYHLLIWTLTRLLCRPQLNHLTFSCGVNLER